MVWGIKKISLQALLDLSNKSTIKQGISEERLRNNLSELRKMIAFYRFYPDLFVDEMSGYAQWIRDGNTYMRFILVRIQKVF